MDLWVPLVAAVAVLLGLGLPMLYSRFVNDPTDRWTRHESAISTVVDLQREWAEQPVNKGTFRKRPVLVHARRWDGSYDQAQHLLEWIDINATYQEAVVPGQSNEIAPSVAVPAHLWLHTPDGAVEVMAGDWIVQDSVELSGREFYPVTPENFETGYDLVEES